MRLSDSEEYGQTELIKRIAAAVDGLWYISETDSEIFPFTGRKSSDVKKEFLLEEICRPGDTPVEERDFDEMFSRYVTVKDWFTEKQKEDAVRFGELKRLLVENLKDLTVYKVGLIQVDIYFVGIDSRGILTGIRTKAVET